MIKRFEVEFPLTLKIDWYFDLIQLVLLFLVCPLLESYINLSHLCDYFFYFLFLFYISPLSLTLLQQIGINYQGFN